MELYKLNLQLFANAGNTNTLGNSTGDFIALANEDAEIYEKEMYDRLIPELNWFKWGQKKRLPKKSGSTVSIRRFENLAVATTAITEGVIPDGEDLVVVKRTATVAQYGNYVRTTEFLQLVGLDDTVVELSQLLGENAGQSIDIIVRDVVLAGTNVFYANGVASRLLTATNITYNDILRLARTMKVNKVKKISMGNGKMGFIFAVDPYVAYDVKLLQEYEDYNKHQNSEDLRMGIIAVLGGLMFVEVDNGKIATGEGAAAADVHLSYVIGRDAYMVPDIEGSSKPSIIVKAPGSGGSVGDPLDQIASVGWKATLATLRIDELSGLRYESLATDS